MSVGQVQPAVDAEALLRRVVEIVETAKALPLLPSSSVRVERDEVLGLLEDALAALPEELRQARWMLKEREEFLAKVSREGDEILAAARVQAEAMVQRSEVVREAQHLASRTVEDAREQARRLRLEAEDYCDQKLAAFEIVLGKTMKTVQAGRQKLQVTPFTAADPNRHAPPEADDAEEGFFDQDRTP